ncbi:heparan-alpha-glucosaminide N-acetyltransferase domain-containing protein [Nocardiopsis rhodophaea]|uniref:Heparan-alpha-glucosaminide N-acetyltransferase domain-containing protein n=1 Tax=Nocardiopsis rhodophaea TaxID=280238 RepID=A0ABN2S356_9ACTN
MAHESHAQQRRPRLAGVDVARGVALIGMFIAHLGVPLSAFAVSGDPYAIASGSMDPATLADRVAALVWEGVSGRSAALFAMLAGVSLTFIAGRRDVVTSATDRRRIRIKIVVRAVVLIMVGVGLSAFGSVAVILHYYGVFFLLALPLLWLRGRTLALIGGLVVLVGPVIGVLTSSVAEEVTGDAPAALVGVLHEPFFSYDLSGGVGDASAPLELTLPSDGLIDLLASGTYPAVAYMGYVIVGMLVGRLDLRSRRVRTRLATIGLVGAVLGYGGSWVLVRLLPTEPPKVFGVDAGELLIADPHSNTAFEVLGNTGTALVVVGLCLFAADRAGRLLDPLASVGTMTLTLYSAHIAVMWLTEPLASGYGLISVVLAHDAEIYVTAAFVLASMWRYRFGRGPLERLLASAANGVAERMVPRPRASAESVGV